MKLMNAGQASFPFAWHGYSACASYDRHYWCRPSPYAALQTCKVRQTICVRCAAMMAQEHVLPQASWASTASGLQGAWCGCMHICEMACRADCRHGSESGVAARQVPRANIVRQGGRRAHHHAHPRKGAHHKTTVQRAAAQPRLLDGCWMPLHCVICTVACVTFISVLHLDKHPCIGFYV